MCQFVLSKAVPEHTARAAQQTQVTGHFWQRQGCDHPAALVRLRLECCAQFWSP